MRNIRGIKTITDKMTRQDAIKLAVFRHPHRQSLKYFAHKVGLIRKPNMKEIVWLNKNTKGYYSIDNTISPHNISFQDVSDAVMFKLVWHGILACSAH
jgi:hypothetical protein